MEQQDIRWKQRFQNFDKAFLRLSKAMLIIREDPDNFLLQAGLIQIYEFTFELSWKTLKDYLEAEGFTCPSPRATLRQAFQSGYIQEGDLWLQALNDRNLTTHTYDEETALSVANNIQTSYFPLLKALHTWLEIQSHDYGLHRDIRKSSIGSFPDIRMSRKQSYSVREPKAITNPVQI